MGTVKCSECGFLAMWDPFQRKFEEAPELFRKEGKPQTGATGDAFHQPKCFMQMADLADEIKKGSDGVTAVFMRDKANLKVIEKARSCNGYTNWVQGFNPKEHREMLDHALERKWRLIEGVIFAVSGALVGGMVALFSQWVAKPEAPVVNISPPQVNVTTPPVNVTVQVPESKKFKPSEKAQSP